MVPVPREKAALPRLVHDDLSQVSANEAARRLNREGIRTKQAGETITRKGRSWLCEGKWFATSILSVKRNPPPRRSTLKAAWKDTISLAAKSASFRHRIVYGFVEAAELSSTVSRSWNTNSIAQNAIKASLLMERLAGRRFRVQSVTIHSWRLVWVCSVSPNLCS